jgi:RNA polymerase sigma-70 factor (ECF subfamily)
LPTDRERWKQICSGDGTAFNEVYRENAAGIRAFLRHATGNQQTAEDLMQETFTALWQRRNRYLPEQGSLRSYLYGIARKRAADWWRTQRPGEPSQAEPSFPLAEMTSVVNDALQRLPHEQRTLLWLREVEGQSYAELASVFDIPVGTVRSRLFAARETLRRIWHSPCPEKEEV